MDLEEIQEIQNVGQSVGKQTNGTKKGGKRPTITV